MKYILFFIFIFLQTYTLHGRTTGETKITAEDGIEVFQDNKYYLLKKNVKIESDNFALEGDLIKIFFGKDLYDIKIIDADGNVKLKSLEYKINGTGAKLKFMVQNEEIYIEGLNSNLNTKDIKMFSDGNIKINNKNGNFALSGPNSSLNSENILIKGEQINGSFSNKNNEREITMLDVDDDDGAYIRNGGVEMFAKEIDFDDNTSIIELKNDVKIVSESETITGDYGTLNTATNSYKIKSNKSKKVMIIISENDE